MTLKAPRSAPRLRPAAGLLTTLMLLLIAALSIPAGSDAQAPGARFTYEQCDPSLPGGAIPGFTFHSAPAYSVAQTCASPEGSIWVAQTGPATESVGWIETEVPATPGGFVESVTMTAFSYNLPPGAANSYVALPGWPPPNIGEAPRSFFVQSEPPPCISSPTCSTSGWTYNVRLACSGSCNGGGSIGTHYIAATEVDPNPPVITAAGGSLLSGEILRGHQSVSSIAADTGGGVSVLEVLVNGFVAPGALEGSCATAVVRNMSYQGVAAYLPHPCPANLPGYWNLNTAAYPFREGTNTVQVCASDFATIGQPNTSCSPLTTVTVNNRCTESAAAGGQNLNVSLQGAKGDALVLPFGKAAVATGSLTNGAGEGISGATICVQALVEESGPEPDPIATATTDANGNFSYRVPPGPNRRLLIGYHHDSFQVARSFDVNSHSKPTLTLSKGRVRRGGKVELTGRLPGPRSAGRVVILQASALHGRRWLTFRKATTGPLGGFRASYRFANTSGTTTYRMRAVVPRQAGYPWEEGHSRPRRIKVIGKRADG